MDLMCFVLQVVALRCLVLLCFGLLCGALHCLTLLEGVTCNGIPLHATRSLPSHCLALLGFGVLGIALLRFALQWFALI